MNFRISWEEEGVHVRFFGRVSETEIREADDTITSDPRFATARYCIYNLTEIDELDLPLAAAAKTAAIDKGTSFDKHELMLALVAWEERFRTQIMVYVDQSWNLGTSWDIQVFSSMELARKWVSFSSD